jgi:hypothetical protein
MMQPNLLLIANQQNNETASYRSGVYVVLAIAWHSVCVLAYLIR